MDWVSLLLKQLDWIRDAVREKRRAIKVTATLAQYTLVAFRYDRVPVMRVKISKKGADEDAISTIRLRIRPTGESIEPMPDLKDHNFENVPDALERLRGS